MVHGAVAAHMFRAFVSLVRSLSLIVIHLRRHCASLVLRCCFILVSLLLPLFHFWLNFGSLIASIWFTSGSYLVRRVFILVSCVHCRFTCSSRAVHRGFPRGFPLARFWFTVGALSIYRLFAIGAPFGHLRFTCCA